MCARNPIHCIVPPHMLDHIAEKGDKAQREWARQTMTHSEKLRGARMELSKLALPMATGERQRAVYTARGGYKLPGDLLRTEGSAPSGDEAADEAYDGLGKTYDFYHQVYERNSLDDAGFRLTATVHYGQEYGNAFWDGRQIVCGDGDGRLLRRFTRSLEIIAHELTHGMVEKTANLAYWEEHGALNESFADVMGSLVKQWALGQSAVEADWLVGADLLAPGVSGKALRSLAAPGTAYDDPVLGTDPQPAHVSRMVTGDSLDNGGVHINSGVPNHAFYVLARELGGNAWERAGRIWFTALRDRVRRKSTFQDAANMTFAVAGELYGPGSVEQQAVLHAWAEVGLRPDGALLKLFREPPARAA